MRLGGSPARRGAPRVAPGRAWAALGRTELNAPLAATLAAPLAAAARSGRPLRSPPPPRMLLPGPGLPFFAPPPTPASLLASTAELILRAKLQQAAAVQVRSGR